MKVRGSRVAVVGGSIAGCAAAIALDRLGCRVDVFERSTGALRDRGSGIAIPLALRDELMGGRVPPCRLPQLRADDEIVGHRRGRSVGERSVGAAECCCNEQLGRVVAGVAGGCAR